MGMPSLLRKVFLVDLLQGLKVTFRYQDPKEIYTEQYPLERPQVAERYRGAPQQSTHRQRPRANCNQFPNYGIDRMANRAREVRDLAKKRIVTEEHDCTRALVGERSRENTTCNAIHFAVWRYLGNCTGQGRECSAASGETCRNSRTSRYPNDCTDSGCSQPARYDEHHAGVDHRSADANHHPR